MGGFDPTAVEHCQRRMKNCPHIVQAGLQHIAAMNVLRENGVDGIEHFVRAGGWHCRQRYGFFDAKNAGMAGAFRPAGKDECFGFGDRRFGGAAGQAQGFCKFDGSASTARVEHNDVVIPQIGRKGGGNVAVRGRWDHHHDQLTVFERFGRVIRHQFECAEAIQARRVDQVNSAAFSDDLNVSEGPIVQDHIFAEQGHIGGHGFPAISGPDDSNLISIVHEILLL